MAAKESEEMRQALQLVKQGIPVRVAAETAGVWFTSLYARIKEDSMTPAELARHKQREKARRAAWNNLTPAQKQKHRDRKRAQADAKAIAARERGENYRAQVNANRAKARAAK